MTRPVEWRASPHHVRVFHETSTVISRDRLDRAKARMVDTPEVTISGITLDEADVDAMRAAMTESYQEQMADFRADMSMGRQ